MSLIRFLNNTSLFVSIGALFTYAFSAVMLHEQIILTHALNTFFLTWCAYQFIKPIESPWRKPLMIVACSGAVINGLFLPLHFLIPAGIGSVMTLAYKNDWRSEGSVQPRYSLRNKGWTKTLATALAWTLITSWWMILDFITGEEGWLLSFPILSLFLWITALALAGDLRDLELERDERRTLPSRWGAVTTKIICSVILVFSAVIQILFSRSHMHFDQWDILILCCIYVIAMLLIWRIDPRSNWHRITFQLDGLLILKGMGAFLCVLW